MECDLKGSQGLNRFSCAILSLSAKKGTITPSLASGRAAHVKRAPTRNKSSVHAAATRTSRPATECAKPVLATKGGASLSSVGQEAESELRQSRILDEFERRIRAACARGQSADTEAHCLCR